MRFPRFRCGIWVVLALAMVAAPAYGWVVVTFDPRTDCLRYDFMGWIRVGEPTGRPTIDRGNAMVRVEVVEALVGPSAGERFHLTYFSLVRMNEDAEAAKAEGKEGVVFLSTTDFNEYPPGSEWVIFGTRTETGEFTAGHGAHFQVEEGRVTSRLPRAYLSVCNLPAQPTVTELFDSVRRVAPLFRLRTSATPPLAAGAVEGEAEGPGAVWVRLRRQRVTTDEPISDQDVVLLPSSDIPRSSMEWFQWFPMEKVWGEAVVDDCAVVLVSARDLPETLAVVPLLFVRDALQWKWVVADLPSAARGDDGLTAIRPELVETLKFWADREIAGIPYARIQSGR